MIASQVCVPLNSANRLDPKWFQSRLAQILLLSKAGLNQKVHRKASTQDVAEFGLDVQCERRVFGKHVGVVVFPFLSPFLSSQKVDPREYLLVELKAVVSQQLVCVSY